MRVAVAMDCFIQPGSYGARCEGEVLYVPQTLFDLVKRVSRFPEHDHQVFCETLIAAAGFIVFSLAWNRELFDQAQHELLEQLQAHGHSFIPTPAGEVVLGALPPSKSNS